MSEIRNNLASWEWCYGKTPDFTISRSFPVPSTLLNNSAFYGSTSNEELKIIVEVVQGHVADVVLHIPPGLTATGLQGNLKVITSLKGCKFTEESMNKLESSLVIDNILAADKDTVDKDKFVTECVRKVMMTSV